MKNQLDKGLELLEERPGCGDAAARGDRVTYNVRLFLRRGDEVTQDFKSIALYRDRLDLRIVDGVELIDHVTELGKRRPIAAIEQSLLGMREGGFREVLASAHLCYGAKGLSDVIPANAMLRIQLWLQDASKKS